MVSEVCMTSNHVIGHKGLTVVPTHTQLAMNIIIVVLLAMVMASVDQSYFGAPKFANSVNRQAISSC